MISLIDYSFTPQFAGTPMKFLSGPVMDRISLQARFRVEWFTPSTEFTFLAAGSTISRADAAGSFINDGFNIDDLIFIPFVANAGTYTITAITATQITVAESLVNDVDTTAIYGKRIIDRAYFYFNLIDNDLPISFMSLIDNETMMRFVSGTGFSPSAGSEAMRVATNSKGWVAYKPDITFYHADDLYQEIVVDYDFLIAPWYIVGWLENLKNGMPPAPDLWLDFRALRPVIRLDGCFGLLDPKVPHTGSFDLGKGNTAWFDEHMNGEDPVYTKDSISYLVDSKVSTGISVNTSTLVDIYLKKKGGKFSMDDQVRVHFSWLPPDESYVNTKEDFFESFLFDTVWLQTVDTEVYPGENFATQSQVIFTCYGEVLDGGDTLHLQMAVQLAGDPKSKLIADGRANRWYVIGATVESKDVDDSAVSDRNIVRCDVAQAVFNEDDSTASASGGNIRFYDYPIHLNNDYWWDDFEGMGRDTGVAVHDFLVYGAAGALLTDFYVQIEAVHPVYPAFVLERTNFNVSNFPLSKGAQLIDLTIDRQYPFNADDIRKNITLIRNEDVDDAGMNGYTLTYPFRARYESWVKLQGANADFPDATQQWSVICADPNWKIKMRIYRNVKNSAGVTTTFMEEGNIVIFPDGVAPGSEGLSMEISTSDVSGDNDFEGNVSFTEDTYVRAVYFDTLPVLGTGETFEGFFLFNVEGDSGVFEAQEFGTMDPNGYTNVWKPIAGENKCKITVDGTKSIVLEALIDFSKLPDDHSSKYVISARIKKYQQ